MFRTVPMSIIRSFSLYTQQWYTSYRFAVSKPVWHIPLLCVQWKTPDDGQRNCPKHVEFYSKNKFEKLVQLVSFIIRIYHNAWSPERQTDIYKLSVLLSRNSCVLMRYCDVELIVGSDKKRMAHRPNSCLHTPCWNLTMANMHMQMFALYRQLLRMRYSHSSPFI